MFGSQTKKGKELRKEIEGKGSKNKKLKKLDRFITPGPTKSFSLFKVTKTTTDSSYFPFLLSNTPHDNHLLHYSPPNTHQQWSEIFSGCCGGLRGQIPPFQPQMWSSNASFGHGSPKICVSWIHLPDKKFYTSRFSNFPSVYSPSTAYCLFWWCVWPMASSWRWSRVGII